MPKVFLGLGTNIDRERLMRAGLAALKKLDAELIVSTIYESDAVGLKGAPFYNCVVQITTELLLPHLVLELKAIEGVNGRDRFERSDEGQGLDIDVLTYGGLVGDFDGVELPRLDITLYAHVLLPLSEIAPKELLPGTQASYLELWRRYDKGVQKLKAVNFYGT